MLISQYQIYCRFISDSVNFRTDCTAAHTNTKIEYTPSTLPDFGKNLTAKKTPVNGLILFRNVLLYVSLIWLCSISFPCLLVLGFTTVRAVQSLLTVLTYSSLLISVSLKTEGRHSPRYSITTGCGVHICLWLLKGFTFRQNVTAKQCHRCFHFI